MTKNRTPRYTNSSVLAMCLAPWQWTDQLRAAASQRKLSTTSVTPISEVVVALRTVCS